MKKSVLLIILGLFVNYLSLAQGSIQGTIYGDDGNTIPGATVEIISGTSYDIQASDINGRFKLKPLTPGIYSIKIKSLACHDVTVTNIVVKADKITFLQDIKLVSDTKIIDIEPVINGGKRLIDPEETSVMTIEKTTLAKLPGAKSPVDMAVNLSTEVSKNDNNQLIIRGARPGSSSVYIDGVKMEGDNSGSISRFAIGSMEIYTGGVPAKYGDFTGGVIIMHSASYFDLLSEYEARTKRFEELSEMEKSKQQEEE